MTDNNQGLSREIPESFAKVLHEAKKYELPLPLTRKQRRSIQRQINKK